MNLVGTDVAQLSGMLLFLWASLSYYFSLGKTL